MFIYYFEMRNSSALIPLLITSLFLGSCGAQSNNTSTKVKESTKAEESIRKVYGDETGYDHPLYKNISAYVCQPADHDVAMFFAYNTVTGSVYTVEKVLSPVNFTPIQKRVKYNPNIHGSPKDGVKIEFTERVDGEENLIANKKHFLNGKLIKTEDVVFDARMRTITFRFYNANGSSTNVDSYKCRDFRLPFAPESDSFAYHLNNTVNWGRGKEVTFSSLDSCKEIASSDADESYRFGERWLSRGYNCDYGFVQISSPMGVKNCEIENVSYQLMYYVEEREFATYSPYNYQTSTCRMS